MTVSLGPHHDARFKRQTALGHDEQGAKDSFPSPNGIRWLVHLPKSAPLLGHLAYRRRRVNGGQCGIP
jgi:hypothetical protein